MTRAKILTAIAIILLFFVQGVDDANASPTTPETVEYVESVESVSRPTHVASDAHQWGCAATRQNATHIIQHGHTVAMGVGYIDVHCQSVSFVDSQKCFWLVRVFSDWTVFGPVDPECVVV